MSGRFTLTALVSLPILICVLIAIDTAKPRHKEVRMPETAYGGDTENMPAATRELYDRILDRSLPGTQASQVQDLLDTAQSIHKRDGCTFYHFQLSDFDKPYPSIVEEGVPIMGIGVQDAHKPWFGSEEKFGHIFCCDVFTAEY